MPPSIWPNGRETLGEIMAGIPAEAEESRHLHHAPVCSLGFTGTEI